MPDEVRTVVIFPNVIIVGMTGFALSNVKRRYFVMSVKIPNGTCRFIVFDFDNHEKGAEATDFANTDNEWHKEVDALRKMCELNGIRPLVERSRSGKGAHVWIFFKKAIPAATAFGKTVVCSYLIAERKVNTLILLQSKDLLNQWVDELNKFLEIKEEPPEYETKTGRKKKRDSVIGILHGSKNTLTGIIDVAMVGSMYSRGKFNERINSYGMVIMDECHHAASNTSIELLQKINAKYVYGVSATPKRGDSLDRIIYMLLGPLRHRFTALERAQEQGIGHYFVPRYTRVVDNAEIRVRLKQVPENETLILVATGQKIGEGFDFPRLDVLMLAAPVSFEGRLEQYVGRLNRDYPGKEAVYVYDYIDSHVRFFDKMYAKRLRTYKKTGFSIWTGELQSKQMINAIFDSGNYTEKFEQDIVEAEKMVVISSPDIRQDKIERFLFLMKGRQEAGVKVTIITTDPEEIVYGSSDVCHELIRTMQLVGMNVVTKTEVEERFAVIDDELVWHGGMNLLGKVDVWDNLMRRRQTGISADVGQY